MTIETTPAFGIGQRAILARTPAGNVLWDCIALIDDATVDVLEGVGGVTAIAISHPHYYTTMVEWSRALGGVPILLHAADRQWVMRPDAAVEFWDGDTKPIGPGLTLVRLGGHFDGGIVLHWADWSKGRCVVLSGDILQVVPSGHVSFMWSYPNLIPLSAAKVQRMAKIFDQCAVNAVSTARFPAGGRSTQTASRSLRRRSSATSRGSERASWTSTEEARCRSELRRPATDPIHRTQNHHFEPLDNSPVWPAHCLKREHDKSSVIDHKRQCLFKQAERRTRRLTRRAHPRALVRLKGWFWQPVLTRLVGRR